MDLIQAVKDAGASNGLRHSIVDSNIYITKELQNMQTCAHKDRYGLLGVKWAGTKEYVWATDGHLLIMRPMGYSYKGHDWDLLFEGEKEESAPPALGPKEFFWIPGNGEEEEIECSFTTAKGKILRVLASRKDVGAWPDIDQVVHPAATNKNYRTIGMNLQFIKNISKGIGSHSVQLRIPKDPLGPVMVHAINDTETVVITAGGENVFTKFGIAMPIRID